MVDVIRKYHAPPKGRKDITLTNKDYNKITPLKEGIQYLREKIKKSTTEESNDTQLKYELNNEARVLIKQRQSMTSRVVVGTRVRYIRFADD